MAGAVTHNRAAFKLSRAMIDVLEFGEDFFNEDSPVFMPAKTGDANQKKIPGIKALGAVFKQFEFDSRRRMIIASHTETGGDIPTRFTLAQNRAKNVLWLLTGDIKWWSRLCNRNHKIEDYKRILKYFQVTRNWDCDPGDIDNNFSAKTLTATEKFFTHYNTDHKPPLPADLHVKVKDDETHPWPVAAWMAVYRLYMEDMCQAMVLPLADLRKHRKKYLKFASSSKQYVACGESFPLKEAKNLNNYNDKKGRRVEILFFYQDEVPGVRKGSYKFTCPSAGADKHVAKQCPIFFGKHFKVEEYIDPAKDLKAVAYHLKFVYYDAIRKKVMPVPDGLPIKAFTEKTVAAVKQNVAITTVTKSHKGVITVKVPDDSTRDNIHFEFKTPDPANAANIIQWWVYTKDKNSAPELKKKTPMVNVLKLRDLRDRLHYYDLPKEWSSVNYWTRYNNNMNTGERFAEVINNKLKLKPKGAQKSSDSKPMMFSLDDIVLVDATGRQNINDPANGPKDIKHDGTLLALSDDSRISLMHISKRNLILYKPKDAKAPYFSDIKFKKNLITDVPPDTRMILFANGFYSVFDRRTAQDGEAFDASKEHIKGCRAARIGDTRNHIAIPINATGAAAPYLYHAKDVGNFELHYIHRGCQIKATDGLRERAFLMVYWNGRFRAVHHAAGGNFTNITAHNLDNFRKKYEKDGMMNAKKRWERKGYTIEPETAGAGGKGNIQIKPVFFFEAKDATRGGPHKCSVSITNDKTDGEMAPTNSKMFYKDYKIRDYLNKGTFRDVDGRNFKTLVVSHELGHAIGLDDEYTYTNGDIAAGFRNVDDGKFSQYYLGMPYHVDDGSMMVTNRAPRMRNLWMFVNRINEATVDPAPNELKDLLGGAQYRIVMRYSRRGRKKKLKYFQARNPNDYRNLYVPYKPGRAESTGIGDVDLALYRLGEDETTRDIKIAGRRKNFRFDGIVVVFMKVNIALYNGPTAADVWNAPGKPKIMDWYNDLLAEMRLKGRFYLHCLEANPEIANIYVFFFPIVIGGNDAERHYRIEVTLNGTNNVNRTNGGLTLEVGNKASRRWCFNYMMGKDGGGAHATVPAKLVKADIEFVRNWVAGELGLANNRFEIKTS